MKKLLITTFLILAGLGIFNTANAQVTLVDVTNFDTNNGTLNLLWDSTTSGTNTATYFSTVTSTAYTPFEYISGSWYTTANIVNGNINPQVYSGACATGLSSWPSGTALTTNSSSIWNGSALINPNTLTNGTNIYLVQSSWGFPSSCGPATATVSGYELLGTYQNSISSSNVSFRYPVDSTSFNLDFTDFQIYANNPNTVTSGVSIEILLSKNSNLTSATKFTDNQTHILQPGTTTIYIAKTTPLENNTTYYAKVRNIGTNSSSTISFNYGEGIGNQYTGTPLYEGTPYTGTETNNGLVSTSSPFYVDCSAYDNVPFFSSSTVGALGCMIKKVSFETFGWILTPPDWALNYITTRMENMKQAFPFSLVYGTIGGIETALSQASSTQPLNLSLPQIGLSTNILSSQTLENEIGTSTKALYDNAIINAIWIFAGIAALVIITI